MKENTKDILFMTWSFIGSVTFFILININFFTGNVFKVLKNVQAISGAVMFIFGVFFILLITLLVVVHNILNVIIRTRMKIDISKLKKANKFINI